MYPVITEKKSMKYIRIHGQTARRLFNDHNIPIMFGEKHYLTDMIEYSPVNNKTFDEASAMYRRSGKVSKVACNLWYFIQTAYVQRIQNKIPGLILEREVKKTK